MDCKYLPNMEFEWMNHSMEHNVPVLQVSSLFDLSMVGKSLLYRLFELQNLYYQHSNQQRHQYRTIDLLMADKFLLHRQFGTLKW